MFKSLAAAIQAILDTILPKKERVSRIDTYTPEDVPVSPLEHVAYGMEITTLMRYRDRSVEDLIRALKYDRADGAAKLLAGALEEYLREEIANLRSYSTKPILLIPVPLHSSRVRERGYNQVEKILRALPEEFKDGTVSCLETRLLVRTRMTPQQTRLSREQRIHNVSGAFSLVGPLPDAHFFLVDDVTTTGATLSEAAKPFVRSHVTLLALAHA